LSEIAGLDILFQCNDPEWLVVCPDAEALCGRAAQPAYQAVADKLQLHRNVEISILLADDDFVRELNHKWRGEDSPTNVLSFAADIAAACPGEAAIVGKDLSGPPFLLGDIVLARQTISREAEAQSKLLADHLSHLVVHGVLHLAGYDHMIDEEAELMEGLEVDLLAALGIANPYKSYGEFSGDKMQTERPANE